jgi:hypothetical protein
LSEAAFQLDAGAGPRRVGPVSSRVETKLLGGLFQGLDTGRRLTVLEIGTALPETVDFFSKFTCRLYFVDLYGESFVHDQAGTSETELRRAFEERLQFSAGTQIDLCLFWDFLTYLDDAALRAFNSALRPWLHRKTRAHGFGAHHLAVKLAHAQYGVCDERTLTLRERSGPQMTKHPHSQIEMHEMLNCFAFERGLLLADGKLEMLLKAAL